MTIRRAEEPATSFVLERVFDAPRETVYRAWTDPRFVALWWGVDGAANVVHEMDVRPGGRWRIDMRVPSGAVYPNEGVFKTVVDNELLEYSQLAPAPGASPGPAFLEIWHRVVFADLGADRTRVELTVTAPTPEACAHLLRTGIREGIGQGLDRLGQVLRAASGSERR